MRALYLSDKLLDAESPLFTTFTTCSNQAAKVQNVAMFYTAAVNNVFDSA